MRAEIYGWEGGAGRRRKAPVDVMGLLGWWGCTSLSDADESGCGEASGRGGHACGLGELDHIDDEIDIRVLSIGL